MPSQMLQYFLEFLGEIMSWTQGITIAVKRIYTGAVMEPCRSRTYDSATCWTRSFSCNATHRAVLITCDQLKSFISFQKYTKPKSVINRDDMRELCRTLCSRLCPNLVQHKRSLDSIYKRDARDSLRASDDEYDRAADIAASFPRHRAGPASHGVCPQSPGGEGAQPAARRGARRRDVLSTTAS